MALNVSNMKEDMIRRAFVLFDRDGDGKISQAELGDVLKTLNRSATEADIRELIGGSVSGMFTARGGSIDFETFKSMLVRHGCPNVATRRSGVRTHADSMPRATALPCFARCCYLLFLSSSHLCTCTWPVRSGCMCAERRPQGNGRDHRFAGGLQNARLGEQGLH